MNITLADLLLTLYVWIDDWYQAKIAKRSWVGRKTSFTDSEMLTLMLAMDYVEFRSERHYVEFIRANYGDLFPDLLEHSQYNRRSRGLLKVLEQLRQGLCRELSTPNTVYQVVDTTPVITVGYTRTKRSSDFLGSADYGYCAAKQLHYFGYKLVLLMDLRGIPRELELVPASTDERVAADEVLSRLPAGTGVLGDKGFIGEDWQQSWTKHGIFLLTPKRKNQSSLPFPGLMAFYQRHRKRIESVYKLLKECGRSVERTLAHTVEGLCMRVVAKVTSFTMRLFLQWRLGINVLTFTQC